MMLIMSCSVQCVVVLCAKLPQNTIGRLKLKKIAVTRPCFCVNFSSQLKHQWSMRVNWLMQVIWKMTIKMVCLCVL